MISRSSFVGTLLPWKAMDQFTSSKNPHFLYVTHTTHTVHRDTRSPRSPLLNQNLVTMSLAKAFGGVNSTQAYMAKHDITTIHLVNLSQGLRSNTLTPQALPSRITPGLENGVDYMCSKCEVPSSSSASSSSRRRLERYNLDKKEPTECRANGSTHMNSHSFSRSASTPTPATTGACSTTRNICAKTTQPHTLYVQGMCETLPEDSTSSLHH
jgi:hypothetical protein